MNSPSRIAAVHTVIAILSLLAVQAIAMVVSWLQSGSPWDANALTAPVAAAVFAGNIFLAAQRSYVLGKSAGASTPSGKSGA